MLIWWLSGEDQEAIGDPSGTWPVWLRIEYEGRMGRAGRGRLWIADKFAPMAPRIDSTHPGWQTPIGKIAALRGGIVIGEEDLPLLADLPGLVTDLQLQRR